MNCIEAIDVMGDALDQNLAPEARGGFEEHMEECPPCRNYYDQLRLTRQTLGRLSRQDEAAPPMDRLLRQFEDEFGPEKN